ncbi:Uncharacterised protein [Bordetella pertussis]|nr:Uncharacterised protein [Bordetella pertussis]
MSSLLLKYKVLSYLRSMWKEPGLKGRSQQTRRVLWPVKSL